MTHWPSLIGYSRDGATVTKVLAPCGAAGKNGRMWEIKCACGELFSRRTTTLKDDRYKLRCPSCKAGCISKTLTGRVHTHGGGRRKNGKQEHLFRLWISIRDRCYRRKNKGFRNYGGRGIRVHDSWLKDYLEFAKYVRETIGERPSKQHSIDRIDNDGHYEPGNIRWADKATQMANRRPYRAQDRSGRRYLKPLVVGVDSHMLR